MKLKWYGTASILLESGETRLLFDPYLHAFAEGAPLPLAEARTADAIFITHPHLDHFDDAFPPISRQVDARRFIPTVQSRLPGARTLVPAQNIWYDVPTLSPAP